MISDSKMVTKKERNQMNDFSVYYNAEGKVMIVLDDQGLELSRSEAEQLFVDLGHVLQDMDSVAKAYEQPE